MYIWSKPASTQVFKHTRKWHEDSTALTLHAARNMVVSGQLCMRDTDTAFEVTSLEVGSLPAGVTAKTYVTDYVTYNDGVPYPDILSTKKTAHVAMNTTQSLWYSFTVGEDAPVGNHTVTVIVHSSLGDYSVDWKLTVYPVTLPAPKDSAFGHEYFLNPFGNFPKAHPCQKPPCEPFYTHIRYDEGWWELMANFAKTLAAMRVNSLHIQPMPLLSDGGSKRLSATEWELNFDLFDRFVEHFMEHGSFRYLTISAIIASVDGSTIHSLDEDGRVIWLDIGTPEAEAWAEVYYGGLYKHFDEKGWLYRMQMRLQDEPHATTYWKWAREKCRRFMPGVICGEPIDTHTISRGLTGECDQYVPRIEVYEEGKDYYLERQKAGDQVWCYSCCYPFDMGWQNKFIDLPPIYSRLMKWSCFTHGITGFLHWGFNYWDISLYGLHPDARFKGDGFIVYPDAENNSLMLSARGLNTLDGLQDWELLNLLREKNPAAAKAISRRVAFGFTDLHTDPLSLEAARAEVLTLLS